MTPVNAMNQLVDDAPRREPAQAKIVRPSAEAVELAWILRGAQGDGPGYAGESATDEGFSPVQPAATVQAPAEPQGVTASAPAVHAAPAAEHEGDEQPIRKRDWSSALDLVQEACEAIRISEERVLELERQNQQSSFQAREDIKALQLQLQASERRAQAAETRATRAEARALEAESWLARLHDAITMGFGSNAKSTEL